MRKSLKKKRKKKRALKRLQKAIRLMQIFLFYGEIKMSEGNGSKTSYDAQQDEFSRLMVEEVMSLRMEAGRIAKEISAQEAQKEVRLEEKAASLSKLQDLLKIVRGWKEEREGKGLPKEPTAPVKK